jgi:hypothetical protein
MSFAFKLGSVQYARSGELVFALGGPFHCQPLQRFPR